MEYKVGDKVKIRRDLIDEEYYDGVWYIDDMLKFNYVTIDEIRNDRYILVDETEWHYSEKMFYWLYEEKSNIKFTLTKKGEEKVKEKEKQKITNLYFKGTTNDIKVLFNKPATIIIQGDRKTVVKAYDEEFDKEKGLAIALLQHFGLSYLDFKRLLASAKDTSKVVVDKLEEIKKEEIIEQIKKDAKDLIKKLFVEQPKKKRGRPRKVENQEIRVGDWVVVTAKERPDYFNSQGFMDYLLDEKTKAEVVSVGDFDVWVKNTNKNADLVNLGNWILDKNYVKKTTPPKENK